jgi:hypothetical protein
MEISSVNLIQMVEVKNIATPEKGAHMRVRQIGWHAKKGKQQGAMRIYKAGHESCASPKAAGPWSGGRENSLGLAVAKILMHSYWQGICAYATGQGMDRLSIGYSQSL